MCLVVFWVIYGFRHSFIITLIIYKYWLDTYQTYLFPLRDEPHESGEPKQAEKAEELEEAQDAQRARHLVELVVAAAGEEEDVVHGDGRHEVEGEPRPEIVVGNLFGVQDDLCVCGKDMV